MGSGYNESEAASNSARGKASTRTPIHFWLDVPVYEYDLGCGQDNHLHTFQTWTPFLEDEEPVEVFCSRCREYRVVSPDTQPLNQPISNDEKIAFEQDKGIIRERIALAIQDQGFIDDEEQVIELAVKYGVPVAEIRKLNAGLRAPAGLSGEPDMCSRGLHEMTLDNIAISRGRRQCKACRTIAQKERRAAKKSEAASPRYSKEVHR